MKIIKLTFIILLFLSSQVNAVTLNFGTSVSDESYNATTWNGDADTSPSKNAVRDKIETIGSASVSDESYNATSWNGVTTVAPSKNAVRDKFEAIGGGTVDTNGTPVDDDFAKFIDNNTIEGRSYSETRSDLSLDTAALRAAEDTMTDGSNLPDGHAIKIYGDANWAVGGGDVDGPATHAADYVPQWNGTPDSKTLIEGFPITAAGKAILDDVNAEAQRTTLGLGSAATRAAEDTLTNGSNLPDGAAIKTYGDANWGGGSGLWTDAGNYIDPDNNSNVQIQDPTYGVPTGYGAQYEYHDFGVIRNIAGSGNNIYKGVHISLANTGGHGLGWPLYVQLDDYSTQTDGSTAIYAKARTFGSSVWTAAIHGEIHDRGSSGTAIAGNFEMWNANSNVVDAYGVVSTIRGSYNGRTAYLINKNDAKRWTSGIEFAVDSCSSEHIKTNEPMVLNAANGLQNIWLRAANIMPYLSTCTIGTSVDKFPHCYVDVGHFTTVFASCGVLTCDYVFDDAYELMSLDELQLYLKENRALPNMTTNKNRDQLDVAKATEELLVKAEEQSLYILQLHDRMKLLEKITVGLAVSIFASFVLIMWKTRRQPNA